MNTCREFHGDGETWEPGWPQPRRIWFSLRQTSELSVSGTWGLRRWRTPSQRTNDPMKINDTSQDNKKQNAETETDKDPSMCLISNCLQRIEKVLPPSESTGKAPSRTGVWQRAPGFSSPSWCSLRHHPGWWRPSLKPLSQISAQCSSALPSAPTEENTSARYTLLLSAMAFIKPVISINREFP